MKRFLLVAIISVVSITTVLSFSIDKAQKVKRKMTTAQVIKIMGRPDSQKLLGTIDGKTIVLWTYSSNTEINFVNDSVESVLSVGTTK